MARRPKRHAVANPDAPVTCGDTARRLRTNDADVRAIVDDMERDVPLPENPTAMDILAAA